MIGTLLSALAGFLASLVRDLITARRQEAALKDIGRRQAEAETATRIAETADAQASVNLADRGDAGDVARRLRDRLRSTAGPS